MSILLSCHHTQQQLIFCARSRILSSAKNLFIVCRRRDRIVSRARESVKECVKKLFKRFLIPINLSSRIVAWICARRLGIASHKSIQYIHTHEMLSGAHVEECHLRSGGCEASKAIFAKFRLAKKEYLSLSVKSVSEELWLHDFN